MVRATGARHSLGRPKLRGDRPRLMFIINSLTGGGAERVMTTLLNASADRRDRVDMSLALLDEEPVAYPPPDWIPLYRLDCQFGTMKSIVRLRRLIRRERPGLTLSFLTRANLANGMAMAGSGRPWIISERINTAVQLGGGARGLIGRMMVRTIYPRATRVIAVSDGVAQGLTEQFAVDPRRIDVIANPVDLDGIRARAAKPSPVAVEPPFVMAMGRMVEKKNFAMLLEAFARSGIAGRLVVAGDGPLREDLRRHAAALGIADRLVLPGFLPNPYALLARADAFCLSSNAEGFPNALVEAMALGVPVVATNCADGPAEILAGVQREAIGGVHIAPAGILVPPGDADSFAQALRDVGNSELRERLIDGGRRRVADYSVAAAVERYWRVIDALLAGSKAGSA